MFSVLLAVLNPAYIIFLLGMFVVPVNKFINEPFHDLLEAMFYNEIFFLTQADNRLRAPRKSHVKDFSVFNQHDSTKYPRLSPQLALATYQFLSTCESNFICWIYASI